MANQPFQPDPVFRNVRQLPDDLSTSELLRQTLDETKELVRLEVELARQDVSSELKQVKAAGILLGGAAAFAVVAIAMLDVALIIALGTTVTAALVVALIVLLQAGLLGYLGYRKLPKAPLQRTR
ncbi:MAG: hypothetical protein RL685_6431, partial [Pseudomonadota bacterium]